MKKLQVLLILKCFVYIRDLPFAQNRFCGVKNIENVLTLSDFSNGSFGKDYGLTIMDDALANLHSRCIVVLDINRTKLFTLSKLMTLHQRQITKLL